MRLTQVNAKHCAVGRENTLDIREDSRGVLCGVRGMGFNLRDVVLEGREGRAPSLVARRLSLGDATEYRYICADGIEVGCEDGSGLFGDALDASSERALFIGLADEIGVEGLQGLLDIRSHRTLNVRGSWRGLSEAPP